MIIQILVLILVLASLVLAYFSARTWHWAHVVLVLAIFLSSVVFMILAAETIRIYAILRSKANQLQSEIAQVQAQNVALQEGTEDARLINQLAAEEVQIHEGAEAIPSIRDLDHKLHLETRIRGRVWNHVAPAGIDPETNTVHAVVESPQPSGIDPNKILFLFEQGEPAQPDPTQGAQYLGEFRVTEVNEGQITLDPIFQLDDFERQRISKSQRPWALYETMPVDRYKLFAGLSDEELRQWLPPQSVEEYLRHGTEAGPDDEEWRRVGYDESGNRVGPDQLDQAVRIVYQRRLRDYSYDFGELAQRRVILLVDIEAVQKDNERLQEALSGAKELQAFREDEIQKLNFDLAGITKDRQAIEKLLAQIEHRVAESRQQLAELFKSNSDLAGKLASMQADVRADPVLLP